MSNNLPPRRPRVPIIKGPKPATIKARPATTSTPQAKPQPAPQVSRETPKPSRPVEESKVAAAAPASVVAEQGQSKTETAVAATVIAASATKAPADQKAPTPTRKQEPAKRKPEPKPKKEKNSGSDPIKILLVLLVLMLGGVVGFLVYDKVKNEGSLISRAETAEQKSLNLQSDINLKVEEISKLQDSIRAVIAEKEALGLALADERSKIAELEQLKDQIQSKQLSINSLNKKLNNYRKDYETAQASMGALVAENQRLVSEKVRLEKVVQEKIDSLEKLASVQVAMAEKASKPANADENLKAENLHVIVYNSGGKEMKNPRAMMAGKIRVSLNLGENKYADQGPKDIYLRVIEPSGNTLYNGSKSFEVEGKKIFYTEKQTVNFNNTKQRIAFMYSKGSRYTPGRYTVEIWSDSQKIGNSEFVLQK